MKKIQFLLAALLLVMGAQRAFADNYEGLGTEDNPYLIKSASDWTQLYKDCLDDTFEGDKTHPEMVTTELTSEANSDNFIRFVRDKIEAHMATNDGYNKPYVFIHGIGKMFPYIRTNVFLTRYEKYNDTSRYKIILFYPGHQEGNSFSLFDTLEDAHTYRAILLVNK